MTKTRLAITVFLALFSLPNYGQIFVFDNTSNLTGEIAGGFNDVEVGDEINLIGGATTITEFSFRYYYNSAAGAKATVRFYDTSGPGGTPGNTLFQSASLDLPASNYGSLTISGMSVDVPARMIWAVHFDTPSFGEVGLLAHNGVGIGNGPGQSRDDYWHNFGTLTSPAWTLRNTGPINNYGAQLTAIPEPAAAPVIAGASLLAFFGLRRWRNRRVKPLATATQI